jgi:hypothetical protein
VPIACIAHRLLHKYPVCKDLFCRVAGARAATFSEVISGFSTNGTFDGEVLTTSTGVQEDATPAVEEAEFWTPAVEPPSGSEEDRFCKVVSEQFLRLFGEALPNKSIRQKSTGLRRTQVNIPNGIYGSRSDLFKDLLERKLVRSSLHESTFYRWLNKYFFFVSWLKWSPFSKCDICVHLKQGLFQARAAASASLEGLTRRLQAHRDTISMARLRFAFRALLALALPAAFLHIIVDGMDSAKTWSPHVTTSVLASKGLSDTGDNLKTKLVGVLSEGRWFQGYITYPHYKEGANVTASILHHSLHQHLEWEGSLPPVLFLQMDNCGRDNKNHTLVAYLAYLVQEGVFKEVYIDFLPVGES